MAGPIKPPRIAISPEVEARIVEQEKMLPVLKDIRDKMKSLNEDTSQMDEYLGIAESILTGAKQAIERIKKL